MTGTLLHLTGNAFDYAALVKVEKGCWPIGLDPAGLERVREGRKALEAAIAAGTPVYGATTGVGALKDRPLRPEDVEAYNAGLVRAHHFGTGEPFPVEVVRAAMAIRVNTALGGFTGCTEALVDAHVALLNASVTPVVRRTGSIGCADIGLMGQIAAVLTGVGEAVHGGRRLPAAEALAEAGISPHPMVAKDSLAAVSSNAIGQAASAHALRAAAVALRLCLATGAAAAIAMGASPAPWEAATWVGTADEKAIGGWLHSASLASTIPSSTQIQDPLSLRMMAQVFAVAFDTLHYAGQTTLSATGRSDDNPIIVGGRVLTSGGSLPLDVAMVIQSAGLALAHVARNAFNRCVHIGNGRCRNLPLNLVAPGAIATGFGPLIKLAGELFARVGSLTQPISIQALVVADGIEDEAAFLPLIVERFERQVEALHRLAAIEALLAAQAMDLSGDKPQGLVGFVHQTVRGQSAFYQEDRALSAEVEEIENALTDEQMLRKLIEFAPLDKVDRFFALGD